MSTQLGYGINTIFADYWYSILSAALLTVGLFKVFEKCRIKKWYAFIPLYRTYKLAQCADMKSEGKAYVLVRVINLAAAAACILLYKGPQYVLSRELGVCLVFAIAAAFATFIYELRIYFGLCRAFSQKKLWVIPMLAALWFVMLIWGMSPKIKPDESILRVARPAALSGRTAEVLDKGLTINIRTKNVGNPLNRKCLLRDIHMNIEPGRMVMLLGGSGAGKTTLVNAVTGYEKAKADIFLNGKNVYKHFNDMKYEIGFVPQQELVRGNDTVYRTIADAAALRLPAAVSRKERSERVAKVLDIFGLTPVRSNMVAKQSGGQKKRISIAMEFISDPFLFVLDEPDSGLDGILARDLMQRLHDISREGRIVIVITHTPDRAADLFDDVIILAKDADRTGRLAYYGSIDEAKRFFGKDTMEGIIKTVNRIEEGGEGKADDMIEKYTEACNAEK